MNHPCPKHILCPTGTGSQSPGTNYSSENLDDPPYSGIYFPPTDYGTYTACHGLCVSNISQANADLCAQQQGKICQNDNGGTAGPGNDGGKQTFKNTAQLCTMQSTGRQVLVPDGLFSGDSQAEANAMALAYANKLQQDPSTPPGPNVVPEPPTTPNNPVNTIPTPEPQPHPKPPTPPSNECKPCDDSGAVSSFSVVCDVPVGSSVLYFESPKLKCGAWNFQVETNDAGDPADPSCHIVASLAASDPVRTPIDSGSLEDCPQMSWDMPCSPGDCSAPKTVEQMGFYPGCCSQDNSNCKYIRCQTLNDGTHWMPLLRIWFVNDLNLPNFQAKKFTVKGVQTEALPTTS